MSLHFHNFLWIPNLDGIYKLITYNVFLEMPCVDNPREMTFLKSQLEILTMEQFKTLVPHLVNRNIDLRLEGRDRDRDLQTHDKFEFELNYR